MPDDARAFWVAAPAAEAATLDRNPILLKRIGSAAPAFLTVPRQRALAAAAAVGAALAWALAALPFASPAACIVGFGLYAIVAAVAIDRVIPWHPHAAFGFANAITLARAGGAALFAALAFEPQLLAGPRAWWALAGAALLLALDGADGWIARRQGLDSAFGARFDMETDALLILALAALALSLGKAGPWVLGLGLLRYGFVAAGWLAPALARPLPPSTRRSAICVVQVAALGLILAPPLNPPLSAALAAAAFAALLASFAIDVAWLLRRAE